ncbi:MAG: cupin domain-containing protein [Chromatiales bacterium]|nr:MAG: cupin domain-containing protein [Chromatiales bacterium]
MKTATSVGERIAKAVCQTAIVWLVLCVPAPASAADPDLVLFRETANSPEATLAILGDKTVRMLNKARDGRRVAVAELPAGWSRELPGGREHTVELLVLEGEVSVDGSALGPYHYAHLPAAAPSPVWTAGAAGARLLLFLDPSRDTDGLQARIMDTQSVPWRAGVVAQRDTGRTLAVEVKDLLWVEDTGQRTWLLRMGADFEFPWEVHDTAEEGFLLEGHFRLGECLEQGPVHGEYRAGGYFYRPAGIPHGGLESGTDSIAFFLLRTPTNLTVKFQDTCE